VKLYTTDLPVCAKLRYQSPSAKEELNGHVVAQLAQGVLQPSKSPWASNIHLVGKKDGSKRLVNDYVSVNKCLRSDNYPLPRITDLIYNAMGSTYYIVADLASAFWTLPLEEESKCITAIITDKGLFEYTVLPFGLKTAPSVFQRSVDHIFGHLYPLGISSYIDDIIIKADDIPSLLSKFEKCLVAARKGGMFFKFSKFGFLRPEVDYLGHLVGLHGVAPSPSRILKLKEIVQGRTPIVHWGYPIHPSLRPSPIGPARTSPWSSKEACPLQLD
jgi:hypothetical protein